MYRGDRPHVTETAVSANYKAFKEYFENPANSKHFKQRLLKFKFNHIYYSLTEYKESDFLTVAVDGAYRPTILYAISHFLCSARIARETLIRVTPSDLDKFSRKSFKSSFIFGATLFTYIAAFRLYRKFRTDDGDSAFPVAGFCSAIPAGIIYNSPTTFLVRGFIISIISALWGFDNSGTLFSVPKQIVVYKAPRYTRESIISDD